MKNLLIFVLLIGLAPSFVGAISLTEDECATLSSISGLSGASIKVNTLTHANGYVGCTAIKTDPVTALGFG
ncbi:MAG: hypothetical protein Q8P01_01870, partial [bacterium]|nr:hypothetical protein [bacterium]